ncbi:MAG: protein-glutamate O-methyltransferase CheR [Nitrospirae bacterium]|nr:protein-glutamate O-methyltransferase CheR [Nitrospirota bacterium]
MKGLAIKNSENNNYLKQLLEYVHAMRGIDFSLYRQATISRKLELRLQETKSRDYRKYLSYLKANPDELEVLVRTLTIKVSNFFRNPVVFELLSSEVIPGLVAEFGFLKVWSLGCADGEEPYSVAMIIHEFRSQENLSFACHIQATDVDPDAVEKARKGEYSDEELFETKRKYIDAYFKRLPHQAGTCLDNARYQVKDEIRSMVRFSSDNIMSMLLHKKANLGSYNLILCRNVLIYLNREMQEEMVTAIGSVLYDKGYLMIGEAETMPESVRQEFEQPFPGIKIFRKRRSAAATDKLLNPS